MCGSSEVFGNGFKHRNGGTVVKTTGRQQFYWALLAHRLLAFWLVRRRLSMGDFF
jgi:hypothetical protein